MKQIKTMGVITMALVMPIFASGRPQESFTDASAKSTINNIRGSVYIDANANGLPDQNERRMPKISVTDGLNVVKTDDKGNYELPANPEARFVSVTTPSGYRSVKSHYIPVESSRPDYNFGLEADGNTGSFEFIHIADTETPTYREWIDNLKAYVATNPTAFIIHTGDICYNPGLDFHGTNVRTGQMGVPMYYTVGNHDLVAGDYGEQLFEKHFGPSWHSFEVGNVHFIALPMLGGDHAPSYTRSQILKWIKQDLANTDPSKKVIMFNHDLWFQGDDLIFRAGKAGTPEADSIDMSKHNLVAFIYGHWHSQYARKIGGAMTICSGDPDKGGIDHSPANFRVISIDADGNLSDKTRARYTRIEGSLVTALPAQHDTLSSVGGSIELLVNAYRTTSPTVSVRVGLLPNGTEANGYSDSKVSRWIELAPQTDWAWSGKLPVSGTGPRRILVEAKFKDGTQLTERRSFMLTDKAPQSVATAATWGNLGGDAAHAATVTNASVESNPQYIWSRNVGSNIYMCSPVVGDGRVFIATQDDDNLKKCHVSAYDAATGAPLWQYKLSNSVKGSIAYGDGMVVVCDGAHHVYAIDAATGKVRWDKQLTGAVLPINLHGLAIADGIVYAGQAGSFTALDLATGDIKWSNKAWGGGEGSTSTTTVGADVVLASGHWNGLFAHRTSDGTLLWKNQDSDVRFRDGSATFYDGNFYLASSSGLFLINPISGDVLKSAKVEGVNLNSASAPVVTDGAVYVGTSDKGLAAFDRKTFKRLWNYNTAPSMFYSVPYSQDYQSSVETSAVLIGKTLVFGASDGYLYGVDALTGRFSWKRAMGAPIFSSPAVSGNAMYIADFAGNLYCFKLNPAKPIGGESKK